MIDKINRFKELLNFSISDEFSEDGNNVFSSVLVMLQEKGGRLGIYFIKRAEFPNDKFSGQIAFPGGKRKKSDNSLLDTAIRETIEEVNVDVNENGEILGKLDMMNPYTPSVRHHIVCPFVVILNKDVEFLMNYEVDDIFWVPISHLIDSNNRDIRIRERDGIRINDYIFKYNQYIIWGLTGRIVNQFLEKYSTVF